jgi:hypothetical protein
MELPNLHVRLDNFMKLTHIVSRPFFTHNVSIEAKIPGKQHPLCANIMVLMVTSFSAIS